MSEKAKVIAMGSDHAGYAYKEAIKAYLAGRGIEVKDFGAYSDERCDYPDFVRPAAQAVARGECGLGIVLGGSGNGEAMVANKVSGIRCAVCWDLETARLAKQHNDANVISIGQRTVSEELAVEIVGAWLDAEFEGGRHAVRVEKIET
ncbi:MAG: ribose 5-phosphate isomerase B [Planctomycetes bacterium]|nr:ribose 5-phosphate isomerase B [Planctomycetota bacterium]